MPLSRRFIVNDEPKSVFIIHFSFRTPSGVRYDYHRVADDLVADLVALLIHRRDRILGKAFILDDRHRVMLFGVKGVAHLAERLDLELFKTRLELCGDHLDALHKFFGDLLALELRHRLRQAVSDREQFLDRVGGCVVIDLELLGGSALAVVVVLGVKTNVLFFEKGEPTKDIWVYDYRTGVKHTMSTKPMTREHLQEFVDCYCSGHIEDRKETFDIETNPNGRWRRFSEENVKGREDLNFKWLDFTEEDDRSVADILDEMQDEADGVSASVGHWAIGQDNHINAA